MIFPLFAKQTKTVAVPRDWGQPPFLSMLQTKAGRAGGAEQGRGQKKEGGLWNHVTPETAASASKEGSYLLSRIALQYHRRKWA